MNFNFLVGRTFRSIILILLAAMNVDANVKAVEGYWTGVISRAGREWKVNVEFVRDKDGESARVDFPEVGAYGRKFSVKRESPKVHLERAQPNALPIVFDGSVAGDSISGRWGGVGVTDAAFVLRRAKKPAAGYREEEVTFTNGDVTLSGTLLLPESGGPHPAIVFTHCGGAQERGPNREPAIMFARRGIAALIYDKRGTGKSTGEWRSAGLDTLAADALAGVRLLKTRKDIDPRRIGVEGHSQGGWIAPLAVTESGGDVALVIVSAASGINAAEQSVFHRANVIRAAGFSEEAAAKASELRLQLYETARTGASRAQLKADVEKVHTEPWFGLSELPHPVPVDEKHGGASRGYGSTIDTVPAHRFAVIVLTNRSGETLPKSRMKALELALPLKAATEEAPPKAIRMSNDEMKQHVGVYTHAPQRWEILVKDGRLFLKDEGGEHQLTKTGENTFSYDPSGARQIVLVAGADGQTEYLFMGLYAARRSG